MNGIAISGKCCSGKNYIANEIENLIRNDNRFKDNLVIKQVAFADRLYKLCQNAWRIGAEGDTFLSALDIQDFFNDYGKVDHATAQGESELRYLIMECFKSYNTAKNEKQRKILQIVATDIIREYLYKNTWVDLLKNRIEEEEIDIVLITDMRFKSEVEAVCRWGLKTLRINESEYLRYLRHMDKYGFELSQDRKNHISETELDDYKYWDYFIEIAGNCNIRYGNKASLKKIKVESRSKLLEIIVNDLLE